MSQHSNAYKIVLVVGSLRSGSYNRRLADVITQLAPSGFVCEQVAIDDLPPYNQDDDDSPAESVVRFKAQITGANAVVFVTPEYNRSIPGVLKNAIDHASRPYGKSVWEGKPAGVIGASIGAPGTAMAQQHLRNILAYLDMPTLGQPEVFLHVTDNTFGEDGRITDADTQEFLESWMERFVPFVKSHLSSSKTTA